MPLTHIAFLLARADQSPALAKLLEDLALASRRECGCLDFAVHQSDEDAALWFVYENWHSRAALERHLASEHLRRFVTASAALLEDAMDVQTFVRLPADADALAIAA